MRKFPIVLAIGILTILAVVQPVPMTGTDSSPPGVSAIVTETVTNTTYFDANNHANTNNLGNSNSSANFATMTAPTGGATDEPWTCPGMTIPATVDVTYNGFTTDVSSSPMHPHAASDHDVSYKNWATGNPLRA